MATFTNQATLTYNGVTVSSNITTGEMLEVLEISKTAAHSTYVPGDELTYTVSLINTGATTLNGITLTDDLGGYNFGQIGTLYPLSFIDDSLLYYVNGVLQATPTVTSGPPMSVTGLNIPAGGNAILVYRASITGFAPLQSGARIVNTVTAGTAPDTLVAASDTVTAAGVANLDITKSMSPTVVSENDTITYAFEITNTGNTAADTTVVLSDTFNPVLANITVSLDGVEMARSTQYTYDEQTGEFNTVPGAVTVPAATYTQDSSTGLITVTPGVTTLTVSGTI
ncbi:MAG: DUF11 domain-containing protein [Clostridia bacterium]|nr:DUF11 domain-containing protein [Clostridia bacterium]